VINEESISGVVAEELNQMCRVLLDRMHHDISLSRVCDIERSSKLYESLKVRTSYQIEVVLFPNNMDHGSAKVVDFFVLVSGELDVHVSSIFAQ